MEQIFYPSRFQGSTGAMASKSYLQRALMIASLSKGTSTLSNVLWSDDALAVRRIIESLGAEIQGNEEISISPGERLPRKALQFNVGESGLALNIFSSLSSIYSGPITMQGEGTLLKRSIDSLVGNLRALDIQIETNGRHLPITLTGPMKGDHAIIDCQSGSQLLSGLLMSLPLRTRNTTLEVLNLTSKPYIDMTLSIMRDFGITLQHEDYRVFCIEGQQSYHGTQYAIEGDWSAMANWMVGAAISGEVTITGMDVGSAQADRAILEALKDFGAQIMIDQDQITIKKMLCRPFVFDATHCPDLFPPLTVLAASCIGTSEIKGIHRLLNKESNRLESLIREFTILGLDISSIDDRLIIRGKGFLTGGHIHSHSDHRIAMAGAISAAISTDPIEIRHIEAVSKSYPKFIKDIARITHPIRK